MQDYLVLDIDSEEDFVLMEYMMRYFSEDDVELQNVFDKTK